MTSQNGSPAPVEVPVLIVGGGASGLLAAYLLSQLGGKNLGLMECLVGPTGCGKDMQAC